MADTSTMGHRLKYGITAAGANIPATTRLAPERCTVARRPTLVRPDQEMRGTVARPSEAASDGPYTVSGQVVLVPRPKELLALLPLIFGGAFASDVLDPALITTEFWFQFDRLAKVYNYEGMKVARATFESAAGRQLRLTLDLEGRVENVANAGTFPSLDLSIQNPFIHHQCVFSVDSTNRKANNVRITVDNALVLDRFFNQQTRTELPAGDRIITVTCDNPFTTSELDLYNIALAGVPGSITWTNGAFSLAMAFPCLQSKTPTPEAGGKTTELPLMLDLEAVTLDGNAIPQEVRLTLVAA